MDVRVHMDGGKKPPKPIPVVLSTGAEEPVLGANFLVLLSHLGKLIEEFFGNDPLGLAFRRRCRKMRELAPIDRLHFSVELRERIEIDLTDYRLDDLVFLGRVVHKSTRGCEHHVRGGAHHGSNARRRIARPIWADD